MNTLNDNDINLLDLPDEILLIICNKLNMVDVLYSLVNVNKRFDQLILDPRYVHHSNLSTKALDSTIYKPIFDQVCTNILPRIYHKVNKLTIGPPFMKFIFGIVDFPQLHSLSLVNFQSEILLQYLTGMSFNLF